MASSIVGQLAKRYGAVIFFPTFTVATIYADWSHTRTWKIQQKELEQRAKLQAQS